MKQAKQAFKTPTKLRKPSTIFRSWCDENEIWGSGKKVCEVEMKMEVVLWWKSKKMVKENGVDCFGFGEGAWRCARADFVSEWSAKRSLWAEHKMVFIEATQSWG